MFGDQICEAHMFTLRATGSHLAALCLQHRSKGTRAGGEEVLSEMGQTGEGMARPGRKQSDFKSSGSGNQQNEVRTRTRWMELERVPRLVSGSDVHRAGARGGRPVETLHLGVPRCASAFHKPHPI